MEKGVVKRHPSVWHRSFLAESGLSHLLDGILGDFADVGLGVASNVGRTDVYEKDGSVVYEMELPGIKKDDVEITVDQGRLFVSGEVKRTEEIRQEDYFRIGRT
jgi:HSP20 family molecular chaperone IbpA